MSKPSAPPEREPWDHCKDPECDGRLKYEDDEYDSLANGGSYERYRCVKCGKARYFMLPD